MKPLYKFSFEEAKRNDEIEQFRESFRENIRCRDYLDEQVREKFDGFRLPDECAENAIKEFGYDRTMWVIANTILERKGDGRFHRENTEWAKKLNIPKWRNNYEFALRSHSCIVDGLASDVRKMYAKLNLFDSSHKAKFDEPQDYTGKLLIIRAEALKEEFRTPENQLFLDETAIVFFTDGAKVAVSMTSDTESLKLALQKIRDNGDTSFSAALNVSIDQLDTAGKISYGSNKNRIILLSDGDDGDYASTRNAAVKEYKDKYIEVYTIGLGSANDRILQQFADKTGRKYYRAMNAADIVDIFAEIGYMGDFDLTDTDKDGLPDAVEAAGIRLQNGQILRNVNPNGIIFTDPTNCDTDGDGLMDGKEIDSTPYFVLLSHIIDKSTHCHNFYF